jgi:hypothetical protein
MIVTITLEYQPANEGNIVINLVDHWYEENYWESSSKCLGAKTGSYTYSKGHRKAVLWDGAGTILMEILDLDMPPYHLTSDIVKGRIFYKVKNNPIKYGLHIWFHREES